MAFFDKCHMAYNVMDYGKMGIKRSVLIRQSDLRSLDHSPRTNFRKKAKKRELQYFPL